jgi:hypothetical protein
MEVSGQFHALATLPLGKGASTHWTGGWVGLQVGLDGAQKRKFLTLLGLKLQPLDCLASSQ